MKIVIDISEKVYNALTHTEFDANLVVDEMRKAIANGTPLPKHHGRLIDADAYRKELWIEIPNLDYDGSLKPYEEGIYSAIMSLDDAKPIIEADKGVLEKINEKQDSLRATCKAWDEAIEKDGYVN